MPTLEEIAARSGVSRSTVSRVVNNDPHVSKKTRQKVMNIIREMNYRPNVAARSLAAGRTQVLGLVIPIGVSMLFTDPYFGILIQGVSAQCMSRDHTVMLWLAEPAYERRTIHQMLANSLIDGVIVSSMLIDDPIVEALREAEMPFVLVGRYPGECDVSYVDVDNRASARQIVNHLLRLGHQRVGTITGPLDTIAGADRLKGYREALTLHRLPFDPALVAEADFTEEGGYYAMQQLLSQQPQAVFVASDTMAVGALRRLEEADLSVPQDVALAGFDDMPFAARSRPPLTTVRQPIRRLGSTAVDILIDLVEHPDSDSQHVILPTELVIRESCGALQR
ncbi:MAG: LacI family DNA-binding transcriptional regulator [Anaerolineae bacterium]